MRVGASDVYLMCEILGKHIVHVTHPCAYGIWIHASVQLVEGRYEGHHVLKQLLQSGQVGYS